jgi:CubicO group peptidase (beta-lactamase class C family)
MPMTRRNLVKLAAAAPFLATTPLLFGQPAADDALRSQIRQSASLLGLPGFVAGVVRDGKLSLVEAGGFADLESRTPMRQDHIFYIASLTKTFSAVMMMQYVQEKKISLDDYVLDYPFLSVGLSPDRLLGPDVKLKHVLSHTSEGKPGDNFMYSGGRYNFVYGVFEKFKREHTPLPSWCTGVW